MGIIGDFEKVSSVIMHHTDSIIDDELALFILNLEDRRFYLHYGVDLRSLLRAFFRWLCYRPNGGASTVDMQLIRTITNRRSLTFRRKAREVMLSTIIRRKYGASAILRTYMNEAYLGEGIIGFGTLSNREYGRNVYELSRVEKARLAAMLLHPRPQFSDMTWRKKVLQRAKRAMEG